MYELKDITERKVINDWQLLFAIKNMNMKVHFFVNYKIYISLLKN